MYETTKCRWCLKCLKCRNCRKCQKYTKFQNVVDVENVVNIKNIGMSKILLKYREILQLEHFAGWKRGDKRFYNKVLYLVPNSQSDYMFF